MRCKQCKHNYKALTVEELCCFCHWDKFGNWSKDFSSGEKKN